MFRNYLICFVFICVPLFGFSPTSVLAAPSNVSNNVQNAATSSTIVINEFMASNSSTLTDADGDSSDWIEIHNRGGSPINLQGYGLSDDSSLPQKWVFPNVTLNAGSYLLVFASGKNRAVAGNELHTNFKLSASGEYLGLFSLDGTVAHEYAPSYPSQLTDISYGIDGNGNSVSFSNPTPNASNNSAVIPAPVTFSVPHGFYNSSRSVVLSSVTPNVSIRYTLDGSTPTASSALYTSPLNVNSSTIVRALAIAADGAQSKIRTQTYLFMADILAQDSSPPSGWPAAPINGHVFDYGFTPSVVAANPTALQNSLLGIPSLSLVTDLDNLMHPTTGIYVNPQERGREWERHGSLELIDPNGNELGFSVNAGIRIRGFSSRNPLNPKHSLRIFFRGEYGDAKLNYPLFGDEGDDEFDKIDLRTNQAFSWAFDIQSRRDYFYHATFARELWSRDTQGAMGQPYTRSRYYHLYLNGLYWGIYQTQERVSDGFGESYFGGHKDEYDVIKSDTVSGKKILATTGEISGWQSLWPLVSDESVSTTEFVQIENEVDLKNLIDYFIIQFLTGDTDNAPSWYNTPRFGLSANWYGIRNRVDGKWHFVDHDSEDSLCTERNGGNGVNTDMTPPWPTGTAALGAVWSAEYFHIGWLHHALMTNDNYVQMFRDRVQMHLIDPDGLLQPSANIARFNQRINQVEPAIHAEAARWGDSHTGIPAHTKADWEAEIARVINNCFGQRNPIVTAQLAEDGLMPTLAPPSANQTGGAFPYGSTIALNHTNSNGTIYFTTDGSDPRGLNDLPTAAAVNGTIASITQYQTTVTARVRNGGEWSAPFVANYLVSSSPHPTSLVVNEYNAVDKDDGAWTGTDPLFAGDPRNGGDWIEFVVVEDMDLRGWSIELWDRDRGSNRLKMTDKFVFNNASMLANLKAGTLFTISEDPAEDLTIDVQGKWDWSFNIQASELTTSALLTSESNVNFNVNHKDFRVVIRNANGDIVSPVAMGETESWDVANGNVSPSEVIALCVAPTANLDAVADYRDEETSSTFGEPNICNGVAQDLVTLRGKHGDVNCDGLVNVIDALFIMQSEVTLRSDVGTCPLTNAASALNAERGNVNRDAAMNVIDALFIMQCEVGIDNAFCP